MIILKEEKEMQEVFSDIPPSSFHSSFFGVYKKMQQWIKRFPTLIDQSIFDDLFLLYLLGTKEYFDHRSATHLCRLVLSMHLMQKRLLRTATFSSHLRHFEIKWLPTRLSFPFFSRSVCGCLIGCNMMDRYELFDEENIRLALQKHFPEFRLVKESCYSHVFSQHKNFKMFYLEIEKRDGSTLSLQESHVLRKNLEKKIKGSIQTLSPTIFMGSNEEEINKNILVLTQEIQSMQDLPQAYISFDQQSGKEIVFRVALVHVTPFHRFSLRDRFFDCYFVSEHVSVVKNLQNHPVEAHIFRLHLARTANLLRSDGSLDFYAARKKVVSLIENAIGAFRDYNGGILIKQQELFQHFQDQFPEVAANESELLETFFYRLLPLEKQALTQENILFSLFRHFLQNREEVILPTLGYSFKTYRYDKEIFICISAQDPAVKEVISNILQDSSFRLQNMVYNIINVEEMLFFNCALLSPQAKETEPFIQALQESLHKWHQKIKDQQVLKIALEYSMVSLDPRIGGDALSGDILRLLFEGLTRLDQQGSVENAVAESIEISPNLKEYTFKLRYAQWNDGAPISAYDFEYAWKKMLSPDFKTSFAHYFYPIYNAKEAKEGKVPLDQIGIQVINDRTFKVMLVRPSPHFLQLTAYPVYSPIHRLVDQEHPQWPYQSLKSYPCNGPFQLKINQPSQGYHLVRNPFYWDPYIVSWDQVIMTCMTPIQALQAFQKKEIDWIGNPFGAWDPSYTASQESSLLSFPNSWVYWCVFNTKHYLFGHQKLRRAFAFAINRAQIIANAFLPLIPAYSPLLSLYSAENQSLFPEQNVKQAQQLFHEALEELGLSLENFPTITLTFHHKGIREYTALCLKQQFQECLGIKCQLKPLSWGDFFNQVSDGDFQLAFIHWNSWIADPIYILNAFKHAEEKINFANWEHKDFQNLLDLSDKETNPFQRSSYLLQAEKLLSQEMPIIPIFYQPNQALVRKGLSIVYHAPCGPFNLTRSFNKKEEK